MEGCDGRERNRPGACKEARQAHYAPAYAPVYAPAAKEKSMANYPKPDEVFFIVADSCGGGVWLGDGPRPEAMAETAAVKRANERARMNGGPYYVVECRVVGIYERGDTKVTGVKKHKQFRASAKG